MGDFTGDRLGCGRVCEISLEIDLVGGEFVRFHWRWTVLWEISLEIDLVVGECVRFHWRLTGFGESL